MTTTSYGTDFVSGVNKSNIYGVQFHLKKAVATDKALENFQNIKC